MPSSLSDVTAVLLVGGRGVRLQPILKDRPKILAPIAGRPFVTYLLDQIVSAGVHLAVLCVAHMADMVQKVLGDEYNGMHLLYSRETEPMGTAGAVRLALPLISSDPVLVMNGDSICDADLCDFYRWHEHRQANASLLLVEVADTCRYGRVSLNDDGVVTAFSEKETIGPGFISAGIYMIRRAYLELIPTSRPTSFEEEIFPSWVGKGLYGFRTKARFIDIGTPESYALAESFLARLHGGTNA